jgi:hypothetical protein
LENSQVVITPLKEEPLVAISINEFVKVLFVLLLAGSMLYMVYKLTRGVGWRNLGAIILPMLVIILITVGILTLIVMLLPKSQEPLLMELPTPTPMPPVTSPLGPVPPWLLWVVGIGLLAGSILTGVWIFYSSSNRIKTIDLVGLEAEKAWQALRLGLDLKDVIIQCYRQMSLVLEKERGVEREAFMTTREFESLLEAVGIPHEPIHQLTRLFEAVRYGNWQPNQTDEQKAIQCLEAIMLSSREAKDAD